MPINPEVHMAHLTGTWSWSSFLAVALLVRTRRMESREHISRHLSVQDVWHVMRCSQEEEHNVTWTTTWERASDVDDEARLTWTIKRSKASRAHMIW